MCNEYKFPHIEGEKAEILYNGKWHKGAIVAGYRFRDGRVNVQIENGEIISCSEESDYMYKKIEEDYGGLTDMRILSQDGKFDFPYEKVCLEVTDSGKIFAQGDIWGTSTDVNYIEIAKYSTEVKARKAMEMLHKAYMVHFQYKTMTAEQKALFLNCTNEKEQEKIYGVFSFPSDDEVEV